MDSGRGTPDASGDPGPDDGGWRDAAGGDAGRPGDAGLDAARPDGGAMDAGGPDAAPPDGSAGDGGVPDAAMPDGGTPEACGNDADDDGDGLTDEGCGRTGPALVIGQGSDGAALVCLLEQAGWTVDHVSSTADFSGDEVEQYAAVVVLDGTEWDAVDQMPASGQQALVRYARAGGGVVLTEWLAWEVGARGRYPHLDAILPVDYASNWENEARTYTVAMSHAVTREMPGSFEVPVHSRSLVDARTGTETLVTTGQRPGVVVAPQGDGRVAWFAMAHGHRDFDWLASESLSLLLVRSLGWSAGVETPADGFDVAGAITSCQGGS